MKYKVWTQSGTDVNIVRLVQDSDDVNILVNGELVAYFQASQGQLVYLPDTIDVVDVHDI